MPKKSHTLKHSLVAISVASLSGCMLLPETTIPIARYADDIPISSPQARLSSKLSLDELSLDELSDKDSPIPVDATPERLLYTINDYVRNLSQDLVANMENMTPQTPMGVTHFAWLDSDLNHSNIMALQMAESFKHEFHQYRIPVVDFKSTGFIRVTSQGDFYLSRDHEDLNIDVPMDYILTGTFARHHGGVLINARIIDVSTKHIVASAQSLIPEHIANAVMVSYENVIGEHFDLLGLPAQK